MNKIEALQLLQARLRPWRERPWSELRNDVGPSRCFEACGESGTTYQGEIQVFWDDKPDGAIRVMGSINDGGWRAFVPLTDAFILAPDGTFVGE